MSNLSIMPKWHSCVCLINVLCSLFNECICLNCLLYTYSLKAPEAPKKQEALKQPSLDTKKEVASLPTPEMASPKGIVFIRALI